MNCTMVSTRPETLSAKSILEHLVAFPTVSRDTNLPLIDWVESYLNSHSIETIRVVSPCGIKAHLFAHVGPDAPGGVVLSGHTDVVPVDGQDWSSDPWTLIECNGRLIGRGACDMKGFDALAIAAMIDAAYMPIRRPLQLALSYDEELGSMNMPDLMKVIINSSFPRAESVIVGEATRMKVVTGHKGCVAYNAQVEGYEIHSSLQPYGVSAIHEAARIIQWTNNCNEENAAAEPSHLALPFDPPYTTLHVGTIYGGTANNITAKSCNFIISARTVPGESDWGEKILKEAAKVSTAMNAIRPEASITMTLAFDVPYLSPEIDGAAEALCRRIIGDNANNVVSYGTDGGHFQAYGYSVVVCGPGDMIQAHQPDEYITLEQFIAGEAALKRLIKDLCQN